MPCDFHQLPHIGIQSLNPYVPGKSSEELAQEKGLTNIIKLASNENQLGCSPLVRQALAKLSGLQLSTYPSPAKHPLRQKLSEKLGIPESMLAFGNGSDTLFSLLLTLFALNKNKHMLTHECAFITFAIQAKTLGIPTVVTSLKNHYEVDIDSLINTCNQDTAIIFIANPNNPTGLLIDGSSIERLLKHVPESTIVVLDEAYYEFAYTRNDTTTLDLLYKYPNLVITRTFSKIYGLASLRLGYAISHPSICELLWRIQLPFVVNQAALEAAHAALDDIDFVTQTLIMNTQGLQQVHKGLLALNLSVLPSSCNFLTFDCGMSNLTIYEGLLEQGIIVRPLTPYGMTNHLRVSIGTFEQNVRFLAGLSICLEEHRKELEHEK